MSIYEDLPPLSLDGVSTYPLASRPSKVTVDDFAASVTRDSSLSDYLDSLPNILAVQSLRDLAARMRRAHAARKPIIWGLGGHVVKTGLEPVILDLMRRGFVALKPKHENLSLLCAAYKARVPFTAHVTIGGDIAHFHKTVDGAALG